jgi:hypothetical protein
MIGCTHKIILFAIWQVINCQAITGKKGRRSGRANIYDRKGDYIFVIGDDIFVTVRMNSEFVQ